MNDDPLEERLVQYLHGEDDAAGRRATTALLRRDAGARDRLRLLRAVDRALADALEAPARPVAHGGWRRAVPFLVAAAAAVAVVFVLSARLERSDRAAARNEFVELRVAPVGGGSLPLFCDAALELHWRVLQGHRLDVIPAANVWDVDSPRNGLQSADGLTLAVDCTVRDPAGKEVHARLPDFALDPGVDRGVQLVRLRELDLLDGDFGQTFAAGRPGAPGEGWTEDFGWAPRELPTGKLLESRRPRLFPSMPGEWRFTFVVETLPVAPGPRFAEPLRAEARVVFTARAGDWSEPVDGIRVRLLVPDDAVPVGRLPLALQIENVSGRARRYNLAGVTQVDIPQPLHQTLVVDGEPWQQRDDLAFVLGSHNVAVPHPAGVVHTVVVMADYWRRDGTRLGELPGEHRVQLELHSHMLLWNAADTEPWQGDVRTPPLPLRVPPR